MLTPMLARLREKYPKAEVVMTTPRAIAPLYMYQPYGVQVVPYDPRDIQTLKVLASQKGFDLAFVPGDNRYSWLAYALGSRWIVALAGDRPAYKSWPVDEFVSLPDRPQALGDILASLADCQLPAEYVPSSWRAPDCKPFEIPQDDYCVLHAGASTPLKYWQADKWKQLAAYLEERGYKIVLSGGPGEDQYIQELNLPYKSFTGELELAQLWHLLSRAKLLVSPDTGVAHMGRLVNVPTVTMFGPGSSQLTGAGKFWCSSPWRAVTIEDFPCRDQHALFKREVDWVRRCFRKPGECHDNRCMQSIDVDMVISAIDDLLNH